MRTVWDWIWRGGIGMRMLLLLLVSVDLPYYIVSELRLQFRRRIHAMMQLTG